MKRIKWFVQDVLDGSIFNNFKAVRMWKSLTFRSGSTWFYYDHYGIRFWADSSDPITLSSKYASSKMEKYV